MHVVHRDLKCENLLLDKSLNIKIIGASLFCAARSAESFPRFRRSV